MAQTSANDIGVLLCNLGTPAAPTPRAVRRYLAQFLADPRVVEAPKAVWWPILHGAVLRTRPRRSAEAYARIWTDEGSPLLVISRRQQAAVRDALGQRLGQRIPVALGMRYGSPSIASAVDELHAAGVRRLLVLPLYPQYSATTAASVLDALTQVLRGRREIPSVRFVRDYHDDDGYVAAVADKIRGYWETHGRGEHLLMSFHGLPKRYVERGDPYAEQCRASAQAVARRLGLADGAWTLSFQSRFGLQAWLTPYTDKTLETLARRGVRSVDLVCPGFSADCLETLEENAMVNRERFLNAGGERFHYIPCLNDDPAHVALLAALIVRNLGGWLA